MDQLWMLLTAVLFIVFSPAMLLSYTDEGAETIRGLQGRYYLPILPIVYLMLTKFRLFKGNEHQKGTVIQHLGYKWISILSMVCILMLLRKYSYR